MTEAERVVEGAPSIEALEAQARQKPDDIGALRELGWAHYGRGQTEQAIEVFRRATERFSEDSESFYGLGLSLVKLGGQEQAATQAFEQAVQLADSIPGKIRAEMLRKLAQGHINQLDHGSWDIRAL
ncbi:MAG TPA: tetratricopeptide repeat protein [Anaerolineales bacterium]|jgi:Flp pilus assembly protein TadD